MTKCGHCHKIGHWHRECPDLHRAPAEKEQHYLQTDEATFCGLLETDNNQRTQVDEERAQYQPEDELSARGNDEAKTAEVSLSYVGSVGSNDSFEHVKPMSRYKDRVSDDWEVFSG